MAMKKLIKNFVHHVTGLMTHSDFQIRGGKERKALEQLLPQVTLQQKHIDRFVMLTDRAELLKHMPYGGICAELGVNRGEFSKQIYATTHPAELHLVDSWASRRYHNGLRGEVETTFEEEILQGHVVVHPGLSTEMIPGFPDNFFDWVYIDTAHDYETTRDELLLLKKKIKPNGYIAGHDYLMGNWVGGHRYGVMEAVHEFCRNENWQIRYLTINLPESPSFAISAI
ncbi:MAG: class I SAM-dependent methyltransferase [Chitinophagaceae bacterium]|nr:MAG: class I SAM-dependent methyltransferase [Chitinophagaceae bacterium]